MNSTIAINGLGGSIPSYGFKTLNKLEGIFKMIITEEKVKDYDYNNTGVFREYPAFFKIFMKQGERFKMRISEEEKEILESEGIKTFVTNKITELHD